MLVSKSNGFNASAVLGSGSYNENKSSKHMELLAHSILKLICKAFCQLWNDLFFSRNNTWQECAVVF